MDFLLLLFRLHLRCPAGAPVIRDNLDLTATDVGNAGIAYVSGPVFAPLVMGAACDLLGPRLKAATFCLLTAPTVFGATTISSPTGFLLVRFFAGFSLAISSQFWMSSMFSPPVVGSINAIASGWGNLGGVTQLLMPLLFELIRKAGGASFTAWRITIFVPKTIQMLSSFAVLLFS